MKAFAQCPKCDTEIEYEDGIGIDPVISRHRFSCPGDVNTSDGWVAYTIIMEWD